MVITVQVIDGELTFWTGYPDEDGDLITSLPLSKLFETFKEEKSDETCFNSHWVNLEEQSDDTKPT
jgi:hypothetical protein